MSEVDIDAAINALQSQNVGVVLIVPHKGVALTGECNGTNKDFTFPSIYKPFGDVDGQGPPTNKDDIVVYDDGVAVTVSSFDPTTGVATLATAPAASSVMTGDCGEEKEPYIAQNVKIPVKYDETTIGRLRSTTKKKIYGAREVTISLDLIMGDMDWLKMFFGSVSKEMLDEPPEVHAYVVLERNNVAIGRIYFLNCRIVPTNLVDSKQGDMVNYSLELTVDTAPILWEYTTP